MNVVLFILPFIVLVHFCLKLKLIGFWKGQEVIEDPVFMSFSS